MTTSQAVMDTLNRFGIDDRLIAQWEAELGLHIPVDEFGRKIYSNHHVNLFKNIQKHLALGRTLDDIKNIISLPPSSASKPTEMAGGPASRSEIVEEATSSGMSSPIASGPAPAPAALHQSASKAYASVPSSPNTGMVSGISNDGGITLLVEKLMGEKDGLQQKLIETEKLNSHLYNANSMFHRRVKVLNSKVDELKEKLKVQLSEEYKVKLMDEKAQLHKKLIENVKINSLKDRELDNKRQEVIELQEKLQEAEEKLRGRIIHFNQDHFCGEWQEEAKLIEIPYDNFGINIESFRERTFRITTPPPRTFGNAAIITTHYEYDNNTLWRRTETLFVVYVDQNHLEGQLIADYILDNVPVARALYGVQCERTTQELEV